MFRKLAIFIWLVLTFIATFFIPKLFAYSGLDDGSDQIYTVDGWLGSGDFRQQVMIDVEDEIFTDVPIDDESLFYILDNLPIVPLKNTIGRTYDMIMQKDMVKSTNSAGDPQTVATTPLVVTLESAYAKDQLTQYNILEMQFEPTAGFTNACYVYSKTAAGLTSSQIQVLPCDPTKLIGIEAGAGNGIPADCLLSVVGDYFSQGDNSVDPVSANPFWWENYSMIIKTPYELSKTAAIERLFTRGSKENELMTGAKRIHMIKLVKALTSGLDKFRKDKPNSDNKQLGITEGIRHFIRTNSDYADTYSTWSYSVWDNWQYDYGQPRKGKKRNILIECNKAFHKFFTDLSKNSNNHVVIEKDGGYRQWGIKGIDRIFTDYCPENGYSLRINSFYNDEYPSIDTPYWVAYDMDCFRLSYLRSTLLETNIQANDADKKKCQFITEFMGRYNQPDNSGEVRYVAA